MAEALPSWRPPAGPFDDLDAAVSEHGGDLRIDKAGDLWMVEWKRDGAMLGVGFSRAIDGTALDAAASRCLAVGRATLARQYAGHA